MHAIHQDAQRQRQELSDQYQNLAHELTSQESRLNAQISDAKTVIEGSNAEVIAAVHHYVSDGAAATQASIEANGNSMGKRIGILEQKMALGHVSLARQNRRLRREVRTIQHDVERMNARLGTLIVTENEAAGDYSIFAGHNLHEIIVPLVMMQSELFGFLSELVSSKKVTVSRETLQDIEERFEELLASCHEASAAGLRRYHEPYDRSQTARPWKALGLLGKSRQHSSHLRWARSSFSMRSGIWRKILPHGILQVRLCPLRCGHRGNDNYSSNEYLVNLTFTPHSWEVSKCLTLSMLSGIEALQSPTEFIHLRSFNILRVPWTFKYTPIWDIVSEDNVEELKKALSAKTVTPWDLFDESISRLLPRFHDRSILHVRHNQSHQRFLLFNLISGGGLLEFSSMFQSTPGARRTSQ